MATKPTTLILIRAADDNYTTGPAALIGSATKIQGIAAGIIEGWKADEKPPAQNFNFEDNLRDVWTEWVQLGSSDLLQAAHIKEADSAGHTKFASAQMGDTSSNFDTLKITPNSGTGLAGLVCVSAFSKPSATFDTNDPLGSVFIRGDASGGSALVVASASSMAGIEVTSNEGHILRGTMGTNGVGVDVISRQPTQGVFSNRFQNIGSGTNLLVGHMAGSNIGGVGIDSEGGTGGSGFAGGNGLISIGGAAGGGFPGGVGGSFGSLDPTAQAILAVNLAVNATGATVSVLCLNAATCIDAVQAGGKSPAIRIESSATGAEQSAHLYLVPSTETSLAGSGAIGAEGSIWSVTRFLDGLNHYKLRWDGRDHGYIQTIRGSHCYTSAFVSLVNGSGAGTPTYFDVVTGVDFDADTIPFTQGSVLVKLSFEVSRSTNTADIDAKAGAEWEVIDDTAVQTVASDDADLTRADLTNPENTLTRSIYREYVYTIPSEGQRNFRVRFRKGAGFSSSQVGDIAVQNLRITIEGRP